MSTTRKQVTAEIIRVMVEAEAAGQDAWCAAERTFPGTPGMVLGEACAEMKDAQAEAWWRTIERAIDGDVIRNAIVVAAGEPSPAGAREAELDEAFGALEALPDYPL